MMNFTKTVIARKEIGALSNFFKSFKNDILFNELFEAATGCKPTTECFKDGRKFVNYANLTDYGFELEVVETEAGSGAWVVNFRFDEDALREARVEMATIDHIIDNFPMLSGELKSMKETLENVAGRHDFGGSISYEMARIMNGFHFDTAGAECECYVTTTHDLRVFEISKKGFELMLRHMYRKSF